MADYFANIGAHMNKEISKPTHSTMKIYSQQCLQSCVLHEITKDEVTGSIDCIKSLFISRIRSRRLHLLLNLKQLFLMTTRTFIYVLMKLILSKQKLIVKFEILKIG